MTERNIAHKLPKFGGSVSILDDDFRVKVTRRVRTSRKFAPPSCKLCRMTQTPLPSLEWCLFLDVDGTLLELTDSPFDTCADAELKPLLSEVAERLGGALALVSGRSIEYLDALFAPLRLPAAGLHGVERRKATGIMHGASFVDSQLHPARMALSAWVLAHPRTLLEDKGRTVAVHFRTAPQFESSVRETVAAAASHLGSNYQIG